MKILLLSWLHRKLVYGQEKEMLVFVVLHLLWRVFVYQYNKVGSWKNLSPIWTPNKPLHRLHFDIGIPQNVCLGNYTKKLLFLPWGIGLYYMCWCFLLRRLKCWRRTGKMNFMSCPHQHLPIITNERQWQNFHQNKDEQLHQPDNRNLYNKMTRNDILWAKIWSFKTIQDILEKWTNVQVFAILQLMSDEKTIKISSLQYFLHKTQQSNKT